MHPDLKNLPPINYDCDSEAGSDEDDILPEMPNLAARGAFRPRMSVSGECPTFGANFYSGPVSSKSADQETRIRRALAGSFMFASLEESDIKMVVGACQEVNISAGTTIIYENDEGDCLYLLEKGEVECLKGTTVVSKLSSGDCFGELALMYNARRAATVRATADCILWRLDRQVFNRIVHHAGCAKREMYAEFVNNVEVLHELDPYEKSKVCDALKCQTFKANEYIIREGETGDRFFIMQTGAADALKHGRVVASYGRGDYFGELALIFNEPRAASIIAKEDCTVLTLDRRNFKRLLGPLEEILRRNAQKYQQVLARASTVSIPANIM